MKGDEKTGFWSRLVKQKMMIVAHDRWIRDPLVRYFKSIGCDTVSYDSGEEAKRVMSRKHINIIIADYTLLDMSGLEFLKSVHNSHPRTLKLYITSDAGEDIRSLAESIGIHVIEKPFTVDTLNSAFDTIFKTDENLATES